MTTPLVSVLIDTYNHERFIEEALQSVLSQDFPPADREILVVDDGSTDRTPEILAKFAPQIRILRKANGGQASAFNLGIPECRGQLIAFLDGDDWWAPNKLSTVAQAFALNPSIALIGHSITEVLHNGARRSELVRDLPRFRIDSVAGARSFRLRKSFLGTSRMTFRAELLHRIGPVPEALVFEADEFLFTLGALFSEVLLLRPPLTFYRLQGQNLFQIGDLDVSSVLRKHNVLLALTAELRRRLVEEHVSPEICQIIIGALQTEADVLRLSLGQGSPLDTFRTELRSYFLSHDHASLPRRFFKCVSLVPALLLSPRYYNAFKRKLVSSPFYLKAREKFLPLHRPNHVDRTGDWNV